MARELRDLSGVEAAVVVQQLEAHRIFGDDEQREGGVGMAGVERLFRAL
jgi:hypothetical protein